MQDDEVGIVVRSVYEGIGRIGWKCQPSSKGLSERELVILSTNVKALEGGILSWEEVN